MLINFSNHPSEKWSDKQKEAATVYGEIVDSPFPAVPSNADERDIENLAKDSLGRIVALIDEDSASAVMVQGEFTLTYAVVSLLIEHGIRAVSACSDRRVTEITGEDGKPLKQVEFCFERFREYR